MSENSAKSTPAEWRAAIEKGKRLVRETSNETSAGRKMSPEGEVLSPTPGHAPASTAANTTHIFDHTETSRSLGSAVWQNPENVGLEYPVQEGGIWIGRTPVRFDATACNGQAIGLHPKDDRHIMLIGGTRGGKGTTSVVPNLLLWPGSLIVNDPKGENAMIAAARRGQGAEDVIGMGQKTYVLDPYGVARSTERYRARWNPVEQLCDRITKLPGPYAIQEAAQLAAAIVVDKDSSSADPIWNDGARMMIKSIILHVISSDEFIGRRNLSTIRELIVAGDSVGVTEARKRPEYANVELDPYELLWDKMIDNPAFRGVVSRAGTDFLNQMLKSEKQYIGMHFNANVHTEFLDNGQIADCVAESDFRLEDFKTDPAGISVFVCLPQWGMDGIDYRWMRIFTMLATTQLEKTQGLPASGHRVLMVLDEYPSLRNMDALKRSAAQYAGAGLKLFFGIQNLAQLKEEYPRSWETLYGLCGITIALSLDCDFTAEYLSKSIGDTEAVVEAESGGENVAVSTGQNTGSSLTKTVGTSQNTTRGVSDQKSESKSSSLQEGWNAGSSNGGSRQTNRGWNEGETSGHGQQSSTTDGISNGQSRQWRKGFFTAQVFAPFTTDNYGNNSSNTSGENTNYSRQRGTSGGESDGETWGQNKGTSGSRTTGDTEGFTHGTSSSESYGATESIATGQNQSETNSNTRGQNQGWNRSRHKRRLIELYEIKRYFARIMPHKEKSDPAYPGLALLLDGGANPIFFRRTNYYQDIRFKGLWSQHADHPTPPTALVEEGLALAVVETPEAPPVIELIKPLPVTAPVYTPDPGRTLLGVLLGLIAVALTIVLLYKLTMLTISWTTGIALPAVHNAWTATVAAIHHAWDVFVYWALETIKAILGLSFLVGIIWVFAIFRRKG